MIYISEKSTSMYLRVCVTKIKIIKSYAKLKHLEKGETVIENTPSNFSSKTQPTK